MFKLKDRLNFIAWMVALVLVIGFVACTPDAPAVESPVLEPEIETEVPTVVEPQAVPPTPVVLPTVLLAAGTEVDLFVWSQTQSLLEYLAEDAGLDLVVTDGLTPEMITPGVQVVVGVGQNLGLNMFAGNSPGVSFVAIGDPDASVAGNLSLIGDPLIEMRQQAFMAGYASVLISRDNKVAALIAADSPVGDLMAESFVVGARFLCGICQPLFPPYNAFPQWQALTPGPTDEWFRPTVSQFHSIGVEVVYVQGELALPELLDYLEELGINVVGDRSPVTPRSNWVGTITADPTPALVALWPGLLTDAPGVATPRSIKLVDAEMGLLSEGRYRLFEVMVADLEAGIVSVEVVP